MPLQFFMNCGFLDGATILVNCTKLTLVSNNNLNTIHPSNTRDHRFAP